MASPTDALGELKDLEDINSLVYRQLSEPQDPSPKSLSRQDSHTQVQETYQEKEPVTKSIKKPVKIPDSRNASPLSSGKPGPYSLLPQFRSIDKVSTTSTHPSRKSAFSPFKPKSAQSPSPTKPQQSAPSASHYLGSPQNMGSPPSVPASSVHSSAHSKVPATVPTKTEKKSKAEEKSSYDQKSSADQDLLAKGSSHDVTGKKNLKKRNAADTPKAADKPKTADTPIVDESDYDDDSFSPPARHPSPILYSPPYLASPPPMHIAADDLRGAQTPSPIERRQESGGTMDVDPKTESPASKSTGSSSSDKPSEQSRKRAKVF